MSSHRAVQGSPLVYAVRRAISARHGDAPRAHKRCADTAGEGHTASAAAAVSRPFPQLVEKGRFRKQKREIQERKKESHSNARTAGLRKREGAEVR